MGGHSVDILTAPAEGRRVRQVRQPGCNRRHPGRHCRSLRRGRVGLFIGVSQFADPAIRRLKVSHKDARR